MILTLLTPFLLTAAEPAKLGELAPRASGVWLVEVTEAKQYDELASDGDKGVRFKLKGVRGTGTFRDEIDVVTAFGGLRDPASPPPKPSRPLDPDSMRKGGRYWVAFASKPMWESGEFNQGVVAAWPEKEPKVAEVLDAAVKADALNWSPQYDPATRLTYGHVPGEKQWKVRVEKDGKLLWERFVPGKHVEQHYGWGLVESTGIDFPAKMPPCKRLLVAPSTVALDKDNEFGLPAGSYHVQTGFDPESGKRYSAWVVQINPATDLIHRDYEPESGKLTREVRFDAPKTGGKAAGARTEDWTRKISRTFDPRTGKVTKEEVFRFDDTPDLEDRWVKVQGK